MMYRLIALFLVLLTAAADAAPVYEWQRLVEHAPFPPSYNYPVYVTPDGKFAALHPEGTWISADGVNWTRSPLPFSGANSAYLRYVQHDGAVWTFGRMSGNYLAFTLDPEIKRTRDYATWETLGRSTTLPKVVFYGVASFKGAMWILGGFDGQRVTNEIWRSADGVNWQRAVVHAPWSPRANANVVVFRDRLILIGGGVIDGPASTEVWSTADGIAWRKDANSIAPEEPVGFSPIVFDNRLWLVGANRSGSFRSEMLVSDDGKTFMAQRADWSPRGGIAPWTDGQSLYITGGKYSRGAGENIEFIYSNDVWRMRRN